MDNLLVLTMKRSLAKGVKTINSNQIWGKRCIETKIKNECYFLTTCVYIFLSEKKKKERLSHLGCCLWALHSPISSVCLALFCSWRHQRSKSCSIFSSSHPCWVSLLCQCLGSAQAPSPSPKYISSLSFWRGVWGLADSKTFTWPELYRKWAFYLSKCRCFGLLLISRGGYSKTHMPHATLLPTTAYTLFTYCTCKPVTATVNNWDKIMSFLIYIIHINIDWYCL